MNLFARNRVGSSAAMLAAIGFAALAVFQAALAAGVPWGHAAWGGEEAHLSAEQRSASAVAAIVYVAAALIVLGRASIWTTRRNATVFLWGTWFFAVVMMIGALPNFASKSRWENLVFGPLALVLGGLCFLVARRTGAGPARPAARAAER